MTLYNKYINKQRRKKMNYNLTEFRSRLLDELTRKGLADIYTFKDNEDYSYIDVAFNGEEAVESYRIKITPLPQIFGEDETIK